MAAEPNEVPSGYCPKCISCNAQVCEPPRRETVCALFSSRQATHIHISSTIAGQGRGAHRLMGDPRLRPHSRHTTCNVSLAASGSRVRVSRAQWPLGALGPICHARTMSWRSSIKRREEPAHPQNAHVAICVWEIAARPECRGLMSERSFEKKRKMNAW